MFHLAYVLNYAACQLKGYLESDEFTDATRYFFRGGVASANDGTNGAANEGGAEWRQHSETLFNGLHRCDGSFDQQHVVSCLRELPSDHILRLKDVDRYNLLEKAVIYRDVAAVKLILGGEGQTLETECDNHHLKDDENNPDVVDDLGEKSVITSVVSSSEPKVDSAPWCGLMSANNSPNSWRKGKGVGVPSEWLSGATLLASFLGCDQMLQMFINFDERVVTQRGALLLSQVNGPPNHLIRLKGYRNNSHFNLTDSDKIFRLNWVKTHQNEPPINLAICGDEPAAMMCLLEHFAKQKSEKERSDLNDETLQTVFSCGSTKCLEALVGIYPETLLSRDRHGWLYAGYGLQHGTTFLASLAFQNGFDVDLLNDMDGQRSLNALHVFFESVHRVDFKFRKYQDLYDMTEVLLELGVDVNMTTCAYNHGNEVTCLHLLMDIVNFLIVKDPSILRTLNCVSSLDAVTRLQKDFDNGIKDSVYYILSSGYQLRGRITDVIQRLFQNRHIVQRVLAVTSSRSSIQMACFCDRLCGFRDLYLITSLILEYSPNLRLEPQRRQVTSLYSYIDIIGNADVFNYVVGHIDVFGVVFDTVDLLLKHGDNPNIYPYTSPDDSHRVIPLIHFIDIYLGQWNMCNSAHPARSFEYVLRVAECLCKNQSKLTCIISHQGKHIRRSVFDIFRVVFQAILTDLHERKDDEIVGHRLDMLRSLIQLMVPYGADTLVECELRRASHTSVHSHEVVGPSSECLLGQSLMAAMQSASLFKAACNHEDNQNLDNMQNSGEIPSLWNLEEFQDLLDVLLGEADHSVFYSTMRALAVFGDQVQQSSDKRLADVDQVDEVVYVKEQIHLLNEVRPLRLLCRIRLRSHLSTNYVQYTHQLHLPKLLEEFLLFRIG